MRLPNSFYDISPAHHTNQHITGLVFYDKWGVRYRRSTCPPTSLRSSGSSLGHFEALSSTLQFSWTAVQLRRLAHSTVFRSESSTAANVTEV
ncbi:unnamed protein product [Phytophthora fragariaefolia]|uniref:Unnamed protein product n=1 Tax=Phytophthora fragariaefolia TaxID=1490495 RepID=A0A9W6XTH6_9STRA|nr:unnamed protein product [Phytophthora fragariaefolia]